MNRQEIIDTIKEMVADIADIDVTEIADDASFMDEIELSSLEVMTMMADLEDRLGVSIDEEKASRVSTIEELADLICGNAN